MVTIDMKNLGEEFTTKKLATKQQSATKDDVIRWHNELDKTYFKADTLKRYIGRFTNKTPDWENIPTNLEVDIEINKMFEKIDKLASIVNYQHYLVWRLKNYFDARVELDGKP